MPEQVRPFYAGSAGPMALRWFVVLEALCVVAYIALTMMGLAWLALVVLVAPFHVLGGLALARSTRAVLLAFFLLLPLAGAGLLPYAYDRNVLLPGSIVLLCFLVFPRYLATDECTAASLRRSEWLPLAGLAVWTLVSSANAVTQGWGWKFLRVMTIVTIEVVVLTYFLATLLRSLRDVRTLLYATLGASALVAVCTPFFPAGSGVPGPLGGKMVVTPFGDINLNTIGYMVGPLAAIALGMFAASGKGTSRFYLGTVAFICASMLVFTKSRGAWLGFGCAFLFVLARTRSPALLLSAAGVGLVTLASDLSRRLLVARAVATTLYDPALLGRFQVWDFAWRIGKDNWLLGVGIENFRYVKHFYRFPLPMSSAIQFNAHNIYLEVFADLGVVGVLLLLWLLAGSFSRSLRVSGHADAKDLGVGLSAGIVAYAAHGLFDCIFFQPGVFALLGVLIGLSVSVARLTRNAAMPSTPECSRRDGV